MTTRNDRRHFTHLSSVVLISAFIVAVTVVAVPFYSVRSSSLPTGPSQVRVPPGPPAKLSQISSLFAPNSNLTGWSSSTFGSLLPVPTPSSEAVATYASDCMTLQQSFTTNDIVCAKITDFSPLTQSIYWVNPDGALVQIDSVTAGTPSATRQVVALGVWKVYVVDGDGALRELQSFSVSDPQQPKVNLSVFKTNSSGDVSSGGFITYQIVATNNGPDTASGVRLTDDVPTGTTYQSSSEDTITPAFTRTDETPTTIWTIDSLAPGASASFTFVYLVTGSPGSVISNTVNITDVTNGTDELNPADNIWTTSDTVVSGGGGATCALDCPNNIVVTTNSPSGAIATYPAPEAFGTCGTVNMSQASNTLFPVGTTTVTATASGGGFCSFTVTVINSPAPTIACPANITVTAPSGASQAFVPNTGGTSSNPGTPTATGNHVTVTGGRSDGDALSASYPVGVTKITWTATECNDFPQCEAPFARSASCTQTITVIDATPLTVTCPANVTVNAPTGTCQANVNPGTATKTPASATVTGQRSDGLSLTTDPYPAGQTAITWTATALDGRTTSCTQIITVNGTDTQPPVLTVPPDLNVTTSTCVALLDDELGVATATDNCSSSVSITRTGVPPGFAFPVGTTIITYVATDASGNTATQTQQVTVVADDPGLQCFPGPVKVWLGLKNSDDVGTKFDLLAEVFKNDIPIGSGQLNDIPGGGAGFNHAALQTISVALSGNQGGFLTGDKLSIRLSVRIAASSGHVGGTARLWFNDSAANSRLTATVGQTTGDYFLRKDINHNPVLFLDAATGSPPSLTVDVAVNRNQNGNAFKPFGTWAKTF